MFDNTIWCLEEPLESCSLHVELAGEFNPALGIEPKTDSPYMVELAGDAIVPMDFLWFSGGKFAIIKKQLFISIQSDFPEFRTHPVEVLGLEKRKFRSLQTVMPEYVSIVGLAKYEIDWHATSYEFMPDGRKAITGMGQRDITGVSIDGKIEVKKTPRASGKGIFVRQTELDGSNFFCCGNGQASTVVRQNLRSWSNLFLHQMSSLERSVAFSV